MLILPKSA